MFMNDNNRDESLFFCNIEECEKINHIIEKFKNYSFNKSESVYIIDKPLGTDISYSYDISDVAIILMPKHPIMLLDYGNNSEDTLQDYEEDLKEDISHISDKFEYSKILGRSRKWKKDLFKSSTLDVFDFDEYIKESVLEDDIRKIDLFISLLIGSINDVNIIGIDEPTTILGKVKRKIILFDGQQSRFLHSSSINRRVTIQGLAGTGKTELLMHKLRELYTNEGKYTIAFTCFNKVLAAELRNIRIPQFFNFMKVSEQIEWDQRLHVFSSWGSRGIPSSGLYSYICSYYDIPFSSFRECNKFGTLCTRAINDLNSIENFEPCFDYIFIDESQDFGEEFFSLCEKVARKNIYIAGDIFQNIFDSSDLMNSMNVDYLLNKCYRTDPRTLMFAHAIGMGLYEKEKINWLDDNGWEKCGYTFEREENTITLSRNPLRRFEDLENTETIKLVSKPADEIQKVVIEEIKKLKEENEDLSPDDIAVIILASNYDKTAIEAIKISYLISENFGWDCTKGYITKQTEKNTVYISNMNNIKGLEFPFIFCLDYRMISKNIRLRNGIYTALTRSFLTSYYIISDKNTEFYNCYQTALKQIETQGVMVIDEPTESEKKQIITNIKANSSEEPSKEEVSEYLHSVCPDCPIDIINKFANQVIEHQTTILDARNRLEQIIKIMENK